MLHPTNEDLFAGAPFRGRGYAPKGKIPVVLANANREKLSVISTVTNKNQMHWKVFSRALNAKVLIGFLKRLTPGRKKRSFLILDNLRVHHSKAVKKWLEANADKVLVFYLPSYSPELNPDELLNADLKQRVTKTAPARTKSALTRSAIGALRSIQKQPERVERYSEQKDVSYAAAQPCLRAGSIEPSSSPAESSPAMNISVELRKMRVEICDCEGAREAEGLHPGLGDGIHSGKVKTEAELHAVVDAFHSQVRR